MKNTIRIEIELPDVTNNGNSVVAQDLGQKMVDVGKLLMGLSAPRILHPGDYYTLSTKQGDPPLLKAKIYNAVDESLQ